MSLATVGVAAGATCAWLVAAHKGGMGAGSNGSQAAASAATESAEARTKVAVAPTTRLPIVPTAPSTQPAASPAPTAPALPRALRLGDEVLTQDRWMRRLAARHGVYVTYDDGNSLWHFKEPGPPEKPIERGPETVSSQPASAPATQASTEPAPASGDLRPAEAFARALQAGATPIPAANVAWPDVRAMELVDPLQRLQTRFPAQDGPLVRTVGTGGDVLVTVNDLAQAEDGTFFVVCTERWAGAARADARDLPGLQVDATAAGGISVGKVAELSAPMMRPAMRVAFYLMVPADAPRVGKKLRLELRVAGVAAPVTGELTAEAIDVPLRGAAESIDDFCRDFDGIAAVRESEYARGPAGLVESLHPPGDYLPGEFTGRILTQVALRHEVLARPPAASQTRPAAK